MKRRLGNFELLEQIDPGGYTVVWKAVEHMGHGVTRPAAVKLLQGWSLENQDQIDALQREVSVLAAICASPNIVTIYGFDIDPEVGPWIAMELGGRSLRHFITDEPATPEQVRQLMRDTLRALMAIHGSVPQILHRDLKPNNILATNFGSWKLADFGLAKRSETDSTLNVLTVQYSAPELLDGSLGKECPATDLYSLGLLVYEYALGKKLYKSQFPSIYDPFAEGDSKPADDRPKWMYWHTSQQMTIKPIADLIPGFPKDVSDLVASMTLKQVSDRVQSAADALAGLQESSAPPDSRPDAPSIDDAIIRRKPRGPLPAILLSSIIILAMGVIGGWLYLQISTRPVVQLAEDQVFKANAPLVPVRGRIKNFPARGTAKISMRDGTSFPVTVDSGGAFTAEVVVPALGLTDGMLSVTVPGRGEVIRRSIALERQPPDKVAIIITTEPRIADALVRLKEPGAEAPILLRTGSTGQAEERVSYGKFDVEIIHPRFSFRPVTADTGADPTRTITARLIPLSEIEIAAKRRAAVAELDQLLRQVTQGDAAALARLSEIQRDAAAMESSPNSTEARRRTELLREMVDTANRAFNGDERASARLAQLKVEIDEAELAAQEAAGSIRRQELMRQLAELTDRAANGDDGAVGQLRQIQSDLRQLDITENASPQSASRRARLMGELVEAAERAARGDLQAVTRVREIRREVEQLEVPRLARGMTAKRIELAAALDDAASKSAAGDVKAVDELRRLAREIQDLDRTEQVAASLLQRRAKLLGDMVEAATLAGKGNIDAAIRLKGFQRDLASLEGRDTTIAQADQEVNNRRRVALMRELAETVTRAGTGDATAPERIRKIRSELQMIDVSEGGANSAIARRRADLLTELAAATEIGLGDENALRRLREIQREMAVLTAVEQAGGEASRFATLAAELLGGPPSLDLIDRATLLALPDEPFRSFVQSVVPTGAVEVQAIDNLRRLRVRGAVMSDREMQLLAVRLEPAMPRLMLELRVDPWAVARDLTEALERDGAQAVRVHPHVMPNDQALFVQFASSSPVDRGTVEARAERFVIDPELVRVRSFAQLTAASPEPSPSTTGEAGAVKQP